MDQKTNTETLRPHLVWIFSGRLDIYLSYASWVRTTHELRNMGWTVSLLNMGKPGKAILHGEEIINLPTIDIYFFRQIFYHINVLFYILANWSTIDLVLMGQPAALLMLPIRLIRFILGKKKPILIMDTRTVPMEDNQKATIRDKVRGWFANQMNDFANTWADGQTAITKRMADWFKIPPDKLWGVWASGVDVEKFSISNQIRLWPNEGEPIHIAYIGMLHYERNLMSLCKAIEDANKEGMKFELSLTGWGTEKEDLEKFASQTEGRIWVNPVIPSEKVPELLAKVHVGALPFPDEEKYRVCSPVKLFEYMASGLPVLATKIVCFTDVIQDDAYTFWAENATPESLLSALRTIWDSRSNLKMMGDAAARAAHSCTWKNSAEKLDAALKIGLQGMSNEQKGQQANRIL